MRGAQQCVTQLEKKQPFGRLRDRFPAMSCRQTAARCRRGAGVIFGCRAIGA